MISRFGSYSFRRQMSQSLIAVCQMCALDDKDGNWKICQELVKKAKEGNAKMVFLPECFDSLSTSRRMTLDNAISENGEYIGRYRALARQHKIWISLGGFHEKCDTAHNRVYITHLVIDDEGKTVVKYRKLHLFDVDLPNELTVQESAYAKPGDCIPKPVDTPVGKLYTSICYDVRFSELCRIARINGAQLLSYPAAFTVATGLAHWEVLLRSRAIDHQCYVVAAAQYGKHNDKRSSYGHSMVVDPWGAVISQCSNKQPTLCFANIDLEYMENVRRRLPLYSHLRNDLYAVQSFQKTASDTDLQAGSFYFADKIIPPSQVFYTSASSYAFVNRKPVVEGHVLVAPVRCCKKLTELSDDELSDMFHCSTIVQRALEAFYKLNSSTVCVQDGPESGQTVPHVHVHILPRRKGDFGQSDEIYSVLERHDKDEEEKQWRTAEEMAKEASIFRNLF